MRLLQGLTRNWADTDGPSHPDLRPLDLPVPVPEALERIRAALGARANWRVETVEPGPPVVLRATHRTMVFRFTDDVTLRLEPTAAGTRVHARSQSRIGTGDFGQNRRNLLELFAHLRRHG